MSMSTASAPWSARPPNGRGRRGRSRPLNSTAGTALLIGHNPGVAELVDLLSGEGREMRTSSIAVLAWDGGWADAAADVAVLRDHVTPRG